MPTANLFIVDDDPVTVKQVRRALDRAGHRVLTFTHPLKALHALETHPCDLIICDLKMPLLDGMALMDQAKALRPEIDCIMITGYASVDGAVQAVKEGAFDYLAKPFTPEHIREVVARSLRQKKLKHARAENDGLPVLIGNSMKIRQVADTIAQIAPTDCSVLITGASGTGKELAARAIHVQSPRREGPFVAFNCGALSETLIDNELFGHEKGAYTGAVAAGAGLFEAAGGGTIFLDEIGDMPLSMQIKLLRVIQERELIRVGGTRPVSLDVRIISATAKELKAAVAAGTFRQDLFFRINVVNIRLPSLNEHREDIPLLAYHILKKLTERHGKPIQAISQRALELLENYAFPGNVRELENVIERAVAVCRNDTIRAADLPSDLKELETHAFERPENSLLTLEELEQQYIAHILKSTGGMRTRAAEILGIDRVSLWRKMKKHGLQ